MIPRCRGSNPLTPTKKTKMNEKKIEVIYILNYFQANIEKLNELRSFVTKNKSVINLLGKKEILELKKKNNQFYLFLQKLIYGKTIMITTIKEINECTQFTNQLIELSNKLNLHINATVINKEIYLGINNFLFFLHKKEKNIDSYINTPYQLLYFFNLLKNKQKSLFNSIKKNNITNLSSYKNVIKYIL